MHVAKVAIDDMRLIVEGVLLIEREELLGNIDVGVVLGGDCPEQVHSAAESLSKMEPGRLYPCSASPSKKNPPPSLSSAS